ncbi:MAG TPA: hypothetical protein VHF22_07065 [Planctomycetota bacterium]|nr:hypothetical protein [Planctomycetota bacterium]
MSTAQRRMANLALARRWSALYRAMSKTSQCPIRFDCPDCGREHEHKCLLGRGVPLGAAIREVMLANYPFEVVKEDVATRRLLGRLCQSHRAHAEAEIARGSVDIFDDEEEGEA